MYIGIDSGSYEYTIYGVKNGAMSKSFLLKKLVDRAAEPDVPR